MFSTSSVQLGGAELPLCPKIGAAQQRRPTTISFNGFTRRNLSRTAAAGVTTTLSPRDNVAQASRLPLDDSMPEQARRLRYFEAETKWWLQRRCGLEKTRAVQEYAIMRD